MKIGVLTYHCVPNFGAQLQSLSTIGCIKRMGHTPVLLHWYPKDLERLYSRVVPPKQITCQMRFAEEVFPLSIMCRNERQLIKEIERQQLDLIVTGSDALFKYVPLCDRRREFSKRRLRYVNNYVSCETLEGNPFFCDYYDELSRQIPVVAFSVSSQSCPYYKMTEGEREEMGRHLRNFACITVRDHWTKQMVEEVSGLKDIQVSPDPVFAFNTNCYIPIPTKEDLSSRFSLPDHYALFSFPKGVVSLDYLHELGNILLQRGITPIALTEPEGLGDVAFSYKIDLPLTPIDWYALIKNADAYIGLRMHPIIVSLHNSTPFYSFDGNGVSDTLTGTFLPQSSKIYDILKEANFLDNTYMLRSRNQVPDCNHVIELIMEFDKGRCMEFSNRMNQVYKKAFSSIILSV